MTEFRTVYKKNKKVYDALFAYSNFETASDMYQKGYSMMKNKHDEYQKAKKYLADHGIKTEEEIVSVQAEKANIYNKISEIKKDISHFKSEKRVSNNILLSMEQIEKKRR